MPFYETNEFISSLAGAFAGALAAFVFNAAHEIVRERKRKHDALVSAQYTLCIQRNDLENLLAGHLAPLRDHPQRDQHLKRLQYPFTELRLQQAELTFLASEDSPNELTEVMLAERAFLNAINCLDRFNSHKERFLSETEFLGSSGGTLGHYAVPKKSAYLIVEIRQSVDHLYASADDAARKLEGAIKTLQRVGKRMLPEHSFLQWSLSRRTATNSPKTI